MADLDLDIRWDNGLCVIALKGEARLETVSAFDAVAVEVAERGVSNVILDMQRLSFIDSASMGSMLRLHNNLEVAGGKLVLFGLQRMIERLIERLGLQQLHIVEDEAAAIAEFA
ncbi:MAG: STAS domain-containing protein [Planctomycetota bacterium]|nr:STAS domain-containing protein [Planctomycetota bacterium]